MGFEHCGDCIIDKNEESNCCKTERFCCFTCLNDSCLIKEKYKKDKQNYYYLPEIH